MLGPNWKTLSAAFAAGAFLTFIGLTSYSVASSISDTDQPATANSSFSVASSGPETDQSAIANATPVPTAVPTAIIAPVLTERPQQAGITYFIPPDADQSVKDALADNLVTFEEYTQAVNNTMACLDKKGVQHSDPVYQETRVQYYYTVVNTTGTEGVSPYDDCWMRYERDVQSAWVRQNESSQEPVPVNEKGALKCAAELGIKADTFDDILAQKREHPQDPNIQHCLVIGLVGYDPSGPLNNNP